MFSLSFQINFVSLHPDRLPVGIQDFEQIKDKYYQLQFFGDSLATRENQGGFKHIYIIGVNFSKETRTIEEWRIE